MSEIERGGGEKGSVGAKTSLLSLCRKHSRWQCHEGHIGSFLLLTDQISEATYEGLSLPQKKLSVTKSITSRGNLNRNRGETVHLTSTKTSTKQRTTTELYRRCQVNPLYRPARKTSGFIVVRLVSFLYWLRSGQLLARLYLDHINQIKTKFCDGAVQTAGKGHQAFNMRQLQQLGRRRQVRV